MKTVFLDRATLGPHVDFTVPQGDWQVYDRTTPEQVIARCQGAQVVVTNKVPLRAEHLAALPELRFIAVAATGYDIIDIEACRARGIKVANVRGYGAHAVPEHVFALILGLSRSIAGYRADVAAGAWQQAEQFCLFTHPIFDLAGKTLGIIGGGTLGQAVAHLGQAFGMKVLFSARKGQEAAGRTPFAELLASSDVISLHCPLTPETRGLIGAAEFAQMARRPLLINTARGGLVDEQAAVAALQAGQIAGLGFDVTSPEPPLPDNPLTAIAHLPNVILTPHVAWASKEAITALWAQVLENIAAFQAGENLRQL